MKLVPLLALLTGCAARVCQPEPKTRSEPTMRAALARVAQAGEVHVLALSGGGSRGAYGAGLLNGWRESGTRPRFNVVTGVSTGALLATSAFLEDDETLERIYRGGVTSAGIFTTRSTLSLLWSDSLTSLAPLERLIEREITDAVIDLVGEEEGRALFVATTSLDSGLVKVWDMGEIARRHEYGLYRKVLLASSSVPAIHSPVDLNGVLHADGGVREVFVLRAMMLGLRGARVTVHVVLNGKLNVEPVCVQPRLLDVAKRGVEVLAAASAVGTLSQSYATVQSVGGKWRLARIPDDLPLGFDAMNFDPHGMTGLYEVGRAFGKSGMWEESVPGIEDATRALEP
jgi:predicted acylesterase/phospholipase RssA